MDNRIDTEVLLRFCEEQWQQARQCENQRSLMANFIVSLAIAIFSIEVLSQFNIYTLPLSILLILLGFYGYLTSIKLFERWKLHERRTIVWRDKIDQLNPNANLKKLYYNAQKQHEEEFPKLSKRKLYNLWKILYLFIMIFGLASIIMTIFI